MDAAMLAALKEEIKAEILREMSGAPKIRPRKAWDEVKAEIMPHLERFSAHSQYQLFNAISTIVRHTLGIERIALLSYEDVGKAKVIARQVVDILANARPASEQPAQAETGEGASA